MFKVETSMTGAQAQQKWVPDSKTKGRMDWASRHLGWTIKD